jgi:hypothetical protein
MKLTYALAVAALTAACGPGASDSHNSSQAGATPRAGAEQPAHTQPVTLTGCLQNADKRDETNPTGTSGSSAPRSAQPADQMAAGRGSPGERFTLTGARASDRNGGSGGSYLLEGNLESLRGNVNHQVRVTGTLDTGAANTAGPQRVRVDAVESLADRCAQR